MNDLYKSQRQMRQMRQKALQRGVIAVLNIGSWNTSCLILRFDGKAEDFSDDSSLNLAQAANFRVIGSSLKNSRGIRAGEIDAMGEAEKAIRTALDAAQKQANTRVDHAIVAFAGGHIHSRNTSGSVELGNGVVSEGDIARAMHDCAIPDDFEEMEVLHCQPVNFALDYRNGLVDPRGMVGHRLSVDMHVLGVNRACVQNMVHCIGTCDIEVAGLASASYVSGIASLVESELEQGCVCIDFGAQTTSISVFFKHHMIFADVIPIGSQSITNDIAHGLKIDTKLAERLKTLHGGLVATGLDERDEIALKNSLGNDERRFITRSSLIGIINPRVSEILDEVRIRLDFAGFNSLPVRHVVLTGGGAQMLGIDELANRILGYQTYFRSPLRVQGAPAMYAGPEHSALIGLCLFAAHPQDEFWDFEMPAQWLGLRALGRTLKVLKEQW